MIINKLMLPYLDHIDPYLKIEHALLQIIKKGFFKWHECYLLKYMDESATDNITTNLSDEIDIECFINHIHMSDFVKSNLVGQAALYVQLIFDKWNMLFKNKILIAYIELELVSIDSVTDAVKKSSADLLPTDVTVIFHVKREGLSYCDDNLDDFLSSAVLKVESNENIFDSIKKFQSQGN